MPNLSLQEECKLRLKTAFDSLQDSSSFGGSFILVVDDRSLQLLESTVKMMDLVGLGINLVEKLSLKRKKFTKMEAVYLVHPQSIDKVLADYPDEDHAQYQIAHILTLSQIPANKMAEISANTALTRRLRNLQEINFNFLLHSKDEVKLLAGQRNSFSKTLSSSKYEDFAVRTAQELMTVLTTMNSFYIVEIVYQRSLFAEKVASTVKSRLESLFKTYDKVQVPNFNTGASQTTFLILERSFDPVTPLLRDFHYLPLFYELKDLQNHTLELQDQKETRLDDNDEVFAKFRHSHLAKVLNSISDHFKAFTENNAALKFQKEGAEEPELEDLTSVLRSMPQFSELKQRFTLHIETLNEIKATYDANKQRKQGELEQTLATLTDLQGKKIKEKDVLSEVLQLLEATKIQEQKAKIALIAILCLPLKPKDQLEIVKKLQDTDYHTIDQKIHASFKSGDNKLNVRKQTENMILNRFTPKIEDVVKELSKGEYGSLRCVRVGSDRTKNVAKAPVNSSTVAGRRKIGMEEEKPTKPRLIVFVSGCLSYTEMRCLSQFEEEYHIVYASHNFVTQTQYLRLLDQDQSK